VAKRLRAQVYGDYSFRERKYSGRTGRTRTGRRVLVGGLQADARRRAYQEAKRNHHRRVPG
jgi:hypothetical protein